MGVLLSFADRLRSDLDILAGRYRSLVARSAVRNVDPNRRGSDVAVFIGFATWDWTPDPALVAERTALRRDLDEWLALFTLLHRDRLPETSRRIEEAEGLLRRWLDRGGGDHSIPSSIDKATAKVDAAFAELHALVDIADSGTSEVLAVPDTNVLLNDPDVATYQSSLGTALYTVVLLPTVMSELDGLKDRGRTPDVRDAATKALRRVKGLRDRGDLRSGVTVTHEVTLRAEHREVRCQDILNWLDPDVPDDRIVAGALDLQARRPAATVVLMTRDLNLQTKAAAVAMPFAEPG